MNTALYGTDSEGSSVNAYHLTKEFKRARNFFTHDPLQSAGRFMTESNF